MVERVAVNPEVVAWAADAASAADIHLDRFAKLDDWIGGLLDPTFGQLQDFASTTHVPLGYFFLDHVPEERLPVNDFRRREVRGSAPSSALLDTIAMCSERQDWFSAYLARLGADPSPLVGSVTTSTAPETAAGAISDAVDYAAGAPSATQQDAMRHMVEAVESSGIMVMVNSLVGNNTHRRLDSDEFQGFTLVDSLAPLVFVNGSDTKNAQAFTLFHEVAHVALGIPGVSSSAGSPDHDHDLAEVERWCNAVAGRVLVPAAMIPARVDLSNPEPTLEALGRRFHVSTLVVLRRLYDEGRLTWDRFRGIYLAEEARLRAIAVRRLDEDKSSGGNPYYVWPYRVGRRFARAVIADAREGGTLYRDAYRLLSTRTTRAFDGFAAHLEAH